MTDAILNPIGLNRPLYARAEAAWSLWRKSIRGRTDWLLLALFCGLQLADIVTTNMALGVPGNWEANPLMAWSQAHFGALWWLPKIGAVFLFCLGAPLMRRRWLIIFGVSYCAITVSGNLVFL